MAKAGPASREVRAPARSTHSNQIIMLAHSTSPDAELLAEWRAGVSGTHARQHACASSGATRVAMRIMNANALSLITVLLPKEMARRNASIRTRCR